jgi:hypothetical protein
MLNWLTRYAPVARLVLDEGGRPTASLLDVGCGPHGFSCVDEDVPFVGLEVAYTRPVAPSMIAVKAPPGRFPFADASFDTVISLDTLEHVPPGDRRGFVSELARVAARRVIVACPSTAGAPVDELLRVMFTRAGMALPDWLNEHDEHGLPAEEDIAACCQVEGFRTRPMAATNGLVATLAVLGDMMPELSAQAVGEAASNRGEWTELFASSCFGDSYRKAFLLERIDEREPVARVDRLLETAVAALRCPHCGSGLALEGDLGRCEGCGAELHRDEMGAWDVGAMRPGTRSSRPAASQPAADAPARPVKLDTQAARRLWLSPDWARPESWLPALAAHVAFGEPRGEHCLCLDVTDTGGLPPEVVLQSISTACAALSGDEPFADVLVVDAPVDLDAERVTPVATAEDVLEALEATPEPPSPGAPAIARHAQRIKWLLDELRMHVARWRFDTAPEVWHERDPLVTVRIATWHGSEKLLSRSIPSVLTGSYENVEVLVCSDGPDPEARAAVESVGDPRVRYLELAERPRYPRHPWSFWEVAGIHAVNRALDEARGSFIAPLDHDDAFTRDHIRDLLALAYERRADLVYGQALCEQRDGGWDVIGSEPLAHAQIAHGSAMYSRRLAHLRLDADAWIRGEPGDWNMWRRMVEAGASAAFLPRAVLTHFRERTSIEADPGAQDMLNRAPERGAHDFARDVLDTPARRLLGVAQRDWGVLLEGRSLELEASVSSR